MIVSKIKNEVNSLTKSIKYLSSLLTAFSKYVFNKDSISEVISVVIDVI